jgi:hypothetical protein
MEGWKIQHIPTEHYDSNCHKIVTKNESWDSKEKTYDNECVKNGPRRMEIEKAIENLEVKM